ncbi:MAG: hypothetical protein J3R72DRAFT_199071 [Linnemannia gamsii]|nr:MAG: hypothetical protein J3R72DRAFT_199071 [Linnemannia gamsii]
MLKAAAFTLLLCASANASFYAAVSVTPGAVFQTLTAGYIYADGGYPTAWSSSCDSHPSQASIFTTTFNQYKINFGRKSHNMGVSYAGEFWGDYSGKPAIHLGGITVYEVCQEDRTAGFCSSANVASYRVDARKTMRC